MIALFFELTPGTGKQGQYLDIASALRPALDENGGLVFLDRYQSLTRPGVLLSHQLWSDEASLARWRTNERHHVAQSAGRTSILDDYRLRVGPVIADGGEGGGVMPQIEGLAYNDPVLTPERFIVAVRSHTRVVEGGATGEGFASVYRPGEFIWFGPVSDRPGGYDALGRVATEACVSAAQLILVSRDYGLSERREAPQYWPPTRG